MNCFGEGLMTGFRVLQLLLSLVVLICGASMTNNLFAIAGSAHHVESAMDKLMNATERQKIETLMGLNFTRLHLTDQEVGNAVAEVDKFLIPVLHVLGRIPIRAIVLSAASFWSICIIIYLLLAQRVTKWTWLNKRFIRLFLELLTLVIWVAGIICAGLLAAEYGIVVLAGGVPLKMAWSSIEEIVIMALKKLFEDQNPLIALTIVDNIIAVGALSIVAVVSACICGLVSLVSLILACAISGKKKSRTHNHSENTSTEYNVLPLDAKQVEAVTSEKTFSVPWLQATRPAYHPMQYQTRS